MKWLLEEDVLYMLQHLMGVSPSLEEVLGVDEVDPLLVDRLYQRATELQVMQQKGKEIVINPAIQSLVSIAAEASEVVEVITESSQLSHTVARYYYTGPKGMVVVETEDTRMLLCESTKEKAYQEITSLIGVSETNPNARPIAVPVVPPAEAPTHPLTTEENSDFQDLVIAGDLWWIVKVAQGQIRNSALVVTKGKDGWMLQQQEEGILTLWPTNRDTVENTIRQFFMDSLEE